MTTPTKPYATTAQVALLIPNLMNGNLDFDDLKTNPKKTAVEQYIAWVANQIEMQFSQAGYIMPFTELDGETWPTHQTMYLELITAMGAAAMTGGHIHKPAPAVSTGKGNSTGNLFQDMFNLELKKIFDGQKSLIRFRSKYYSSTPAEHSVMEPYGPSLDYMTGDMNREDFLMLEEYTDLRLSITRYMTYSYQVNPINWNDFHGLSSGKMNVYGFSI